MTDELKFTFPPETETTNEIPIVGAFKSGVDVSVQDAPELSHVVITVPNLFAPPDSVTQ